VAGIWSNTCAIVTSIIANRDTNAVFLDVTFATDFHLNFMVKHIIIPIKLAEDGKVCR
jgi:hypothetical protein